MALKDYVCDKCGYTEEFIFSISLPKPAIPEVCPKCGQGKFEYKFNVSGISFDCPGGYDYTYGKKKNWKSKVDSDSPY